MAERGWRCGQASSGGRIGLPARLGSEEQILAGPMGPPPSIIAERANGSKVLRTSSACQERGLEGGLPVWMRGPIPFRRESTPEISDSNRLQGRLPAWTKVGRTTGANGYRPDPRLYRTVSDGAHPTLTGGTEPCLHQGPGGRHPRCARRAESAEALAWKEEFLCCLGSRTGAEPWRPPLAVSAVFISAPV